VEGLLDRTVAMASQTISPTTASLLSVLAHLYLWCDLDQLPLDDGGAAGSAGCGLITQGAHSRSGKLQRLAECTAGAGRLRTGIQWRATSQCKRWRASQVRLSSFSGLAEDVDWGISRCESNSLRLDRRVTPAQAAAVRLGVASAEATAAAKVARSDAGDHVGAAFLDDELVFVPFTLVQAGWSSQARELLPLVLPAELRGSVGCWKGKLICFVTGNLSLAFDIYRCNASSSVTRRLLSRLFDAAKADDFEVCALWISRVHNTVPGRCCRLPFGRAVGGAPPSGCGGRCRHEQLIDRDGCGDPSPSCYCNQPDWRAHGQLSATEEAEVRDVLIPNLAKAFPSIIAL